MSIFEIFKGNTGESDAVKNALARQRERDLNKGVAEAEEARKTALEGSESDFMVGDRAAQVAAKEDLIAKKAAETARLEKDKAEMEAIARKIAEGGEQ